MVLGNEAVAGFCAGAVGTIFGYPLDVVKTRMQTSQLGIVPTIRAIAADGGVASFYIGIASPLLSLTILNTMNFALYNHMCRFYGVNKKMSDHEGPNSFFGNYAIAGASVGPFSAFISTPFELVKTQMQLQRKSSNGHHMGSVSMARYIVMNHGIKYLFQGHAVNTAREVAFLGTYFMVYENLKKLFVDKFQFIGTVAIPIAGGISGATGWAISFPLDNVKSNIQGAVLGDGQMKPKAFEVAKSLIATKGFRGLYSGVLPSIMRSFIVSATRFSVYESCLEALR